MGDDPLKLDRQVCFPLYAATNLINRLYRPILAGLGITYPQYLTLLVLWENDRLSVGELGARLYLDSGTLTPLLKRMEANGLILRQRDPEDERRVIIALTEKGDVLREDARHIPKTLAGGYTGNDLDDLREAVTQLVKVLAKHECEARSNRSTLRDIHHSLG